MLKTITVRTEARSQLVDISHQVTEAIHEAGIREGVATIFVPHTTAGVTVNENADPDVMRDIVYKLDRVFPQDDSYRHAEGNSDAHIKCALVGPSLQLIVHEGRALLGTWQGIYFCEFDGPRTRQCHIQVMG